MRLVSLGDLALDVVVSLAGPLLEGDDSPATTHIDIGGQAANVAAWAASLGAQARYIGKRGADTAALLLATELEARGVELAGPSEGRSAVVVSLSSAGERSLASDRGSAAQLRPDELEPAWFRCEVLHVSGYALAREPAAAAALRAGELARAAGAHVSLDLASAGLIDEPFRRRALALAPATVFATEAEQRRFGELRASWVVKRGARGIVVDGVPHAAHPTELTDTTGAGDALAAGYLVGGVELGLRAAARCCARLGSMP
jgi:sugar/nucleoside kinase (ribokinase family)